MNKTMTSAQIVAHSIDPRGNELVSILATFPRIILAEVNTHRMLSKNTSSSRAIPFNKMIEAIRTNPFIPIAWQKSHKGMQGSEYFTKEDDIQGAIDEWLESRDGQIANAKQLNKQGVTKQLCNRLLEPFMWTTMLITGSKEGWNNFFELRCPQYTTPVAGDGYYAKSWKELCSWHSNPVNEEILEKADLLFKLKHNRGQAEIHMMDLAEKIFDAMNKSAPKQLNPGEWHIPLIEGADNSLSIDDKIKYSVGRAANTSYTVVGDGKKLTLEQAIKIHDKCKELSHSSVFEHCARAMTDEEYDSFIKGELTLEKITQNFQHYKMDREDRHNIGWCRNFKGFMQYRYFVENEIKI